MKNTLVGIRIKPQKEKSSRLDCRQHIFVIGNTPFVRDAKIIREKHTGNIKRFTTGVKQFNPVLELTEFICDHCVVNSEKFIYDNRRLYASPNFSHIQ
ncbi:hypothetical protein ES708_04147 [subsurface metagenome]